MMSALAMGFTSCSDDDFTETIFPDQSEELDPNSLLLISSTSG